MLLEVRVIRLVMTVALVGVAISTFQGAGGAESREIAHPAGGVPGKYDHIPAGTSGRSHGGARAIGGLVSGMIDDQAPESVNLDPERMRALGEAFLGG